MCGKGSSCVRGLFNIMVECVVKGHRVCGKGLSCVRG